MRADINGVPIAQKKNKSKKKRKKKRFAFFLASFEAKRKSEAYIYRHLYITPYDNTSVFILQRKCLIISTGVTVSWYTIYTHWGIY